MSDNSKGKNRPTQKWTNLPTWQIYYFGDTEERHESAVDFFFKPLNIWVPGQVFTSKEVKKCVCKKIRF